MRALLPFASVVLLAAPSAGGIIDKKITGEINRRAGGVSARFRASPTSTFRWLSPKGTGSDVTVDRAGESPLTKLVRLRLRGGWLGVEVVQEIAKAYLSSSGKPGEGGGKKGAGDGRGQDGGGGRGKGPGGRGRGTGSGDGSRNEDGKAARNSRTDNNSGGRNSKKDGFGFRLPRLPSFSSKDEDRSKSDRTNHDNNGVSAGFGRGDGSETTRGSERDSDGGVAAEDKVERLRTALQAAVADAEADDVDLNKLETFFGARSSSSGGAGGGGGSSGGSATNHRRYASQSSSSSQPPTSPEDGSSFPVNRGIPPQQAEGGGYQDGGVFAGEGHASGDGWEEESSGVWGSVGDGLEEDLDFGGYGGGGGRGAEEEEDEEMARARAAAAASARARDEVALLREIQALGDQQAQAENLPPLGQHTKSVVTEAMPQRFVDEVGAHIASALAIAAVKGLIETIANLRGQKKPEKVAFSDVVGCDEAKDEIKQIVDFLVDPSAYDKLGASRPKGILLVGPPGTGKTLIAKACAGEAGVPFLYACGSDFNGVYVGMGVAAVKKLFAKARKHKKSIIYIDEIDYLGRSRNSGARDASGATQDREATLNQLLSEMDGFEGKDGIVVMASTNRKDILDEALLRSGRFDMQVDVERPDRKGREQLFAKYMGALKLSDGDTIVEAAKDLQSIEARQRAGRHYFGGGAAAAALVAKKENEEAVKAQGLRDDIAKELADLTPYMTGADVANVCATAGRIAARAGSDAVSLEHFSAAVDRVCHGLEKPGKEIPREEQERTAVHEAGHAVAGWMLPWCEQVVKVSIIWRGNALGFSQTAMTERLNDMRETVLDDVCMTLAGRAAEEVVYGTISSGASSDLRTASRQLYRAITEVGFGSGTGLLAPGERRLSERVMAEVDQEVQGILAEQYERALSLMRQHRDKIDRLSAALLESGVVHKTDLEGILGDKVTVKSAAAEAAAAAASQATAADMVDSPTNPSHDGLAEEMGPPREMSQAKA